MAYAKRSACLKTNRTRTQRECTRACVWRRDLGHVFLMEGTASGALWTPEPTGWAARSDVLVRNPFNQRLFHCSNHICMRNLPVSSSLALPRSRSERPPPDQNAARVRRRGLRRRQHGGCLSLTRGLDQPDSGS